MSVEVPDGLTVASRVVVRAPPTAVWRALVALEDYPSWNPIILEARGVLATGERLWLRVRIGPLRLAIRPTVLEVVPGARLRWVGRLAHPALLEGDHLIELFALPGDRTQLVHSETLRGALLPLAGPLARANARGFAEMDEALRRRVEAMHARVPA
jgi:hypothetical protein